MINSKNKIHQGGGRKEYIDLAKGFCIYQKSEQIIDTLFLFLFLYRSDCTIHSTRIKCRYGNQVCHRMA